ncbi:MAG: LCP family protein [Clostridia bacterium]|nr:LCP family protein [Clostridia bacterium]
MKPFNNRKLNQTKQIASSLVWILGIALLTALLCAMSLSGERVAGEEAVDADHALEGCFRVLVAAKDRTSGLCDVMMLLSLDRDQNTLSVLQIPRDTYARLGEGSYRKINGAPAALGGMPAFRQAMEQTLGISIDRYVRLSPDAFRKGVDALGGVELTLDEPMDYEDPIQGLSIHLKKGTQLLDGKEAEWFVRYRADYVRGDLGRLDAQKQFLAAFVRKALALRSPMGLARLAAAILEDVDTDLGASDLFMLSEATMELSSEKILFVTAPGEDAVGKNGGSYYVLSAKGMEALLSDHFGKEQEGFDPQKSFLNANSEAFRRIYESKISYRIYTSREIGESGISIPRT